jgi:lysophospholipase L1-like esterase
MNFIHAKSYRKITIIAIIAALLSIFISPISAKASVQTAWSVPDGSDAVQVGPDNLPRAMDCTYYREIHAYSQLGQERFSISGNSSEAIDVGCGNYYAWSSLRKSDSISESGNTVVIFDTDSSTKADTIRLYSDTGSLVWSYSVLDECNNLADIGSSPVISNGKVVFSYWSCLTGSYNIRAVNETDHSVTYEIPNVIGYTASPSLTWFEQGVAIFHGSYGVDYISDTGSIDTSRTVTFGNGYALAIDVDGTVAYFTHDENDYGICYIVFDSYSQPPINREVDCNKQIYNGKFMPNGDLATISDYGTVSGNGEVTIYPVSLASATTTISVASPIQAKSGTFGAWRYFVDANGKIVMYFEYEEDVYENNNYKDTYWRAAFQTFGSTGLPESSWNSSAYDRDITIDADVAFSLANGGVYINDRDHNSMIYIRIPSISIGYTESVKWGIQPDSNIGAKYVALGDSYSAGTGTFNSDIDNVCKRSTDNYAYYIAENSTRGIETPDIAACNGAVTADIMPSSGDVSQSDVLGDGTEFVTLTIGGNDVGFERILSRCITTALNIGYGCSGDSSFTLPISQRIAALAGTSSSTQYSPADNKEIYSIAEVLDRIVTKAPNAEVYIAGYPELFGSAVYHDYEPLTSPSGYVCHVNTTSPITAKVDSYDTLWLNDQAELLNTVISNAVEDARQQGKNVHYVSPSNFYGHALCDEHSPWINDVVIDTDAVPPTPLPESIHPTTQGYALGYGEAFLEEMD